MLELRDVRIEAVLEARNVILVLAAQSAHVLLDGAEPRLDSAKPRFDGAEPRLDGAEPRREVRNRAPRRRALLLHRAREGLESGLHLWRWYGRPFFEIRPREPSFLLCLHPTVFLAFCASLYRRTTTVVSVIAVPSSGCHWPACRL